MVDVVCIAHFIILFVSQVRMAHLKHVFRLSWSSSQPIDNWVCIHDNHLSVCNVRSLVQYRLVSGFGVIKGAHGNVGNVSHARLDLKDTN